MICSSWNKTVLIYVYDVISVENICKYLMSSQINYNWIYISSQSYFFIGNTLCPFHALPIPWKPIYPCSIEAKLAQTLSPLHRRILWLKKVGNYIMPFKLIFLHKAIYIFLAFGYLKNANPSILCIFILFNQNICSYNLKYCFLWFICRFYQGSRGIISQFS